MGMLAGMTDDQTQAWPSVRYSAQSLCRSATGLPTAKALPVSFGFSPQIVMWPVRLHRNAARPAALLRQLRVGRKAPLEILKPSKVAR